MLCGTFEFRAPNGTAALPPEREPAEEVPAEPPAQPQAHNPLMQQPLPPAGPRPVSPPSSAFVIKRVRVGRRGGSIHAIDLPGPGSLELVATANLRSSRARAGKRVVVGHARRVVSAARVVPVPLRPNRAGRAQLKRHRRLRVAGNDPLHPDRREGPRAL
jgi:hypothetical protein